MRTIITLTLAALLSASVWPGPVSGIVQTSATPRQAEVRVDANNFDSYVGQYQDDGLTDFIYSYYPEGDKLYAQFLSRPKYEVIPLWEARPVGDIRVPYKRIEAMIPMRDGIKLFTVILTPENQSESLPIILNRTPYGVQDWNSDLLNSNRSELAKDGYIFAFQDIRGKHNSEGEFVMMRPPRDKRDVKSIDESTDAYDTIDWLINNVPRNNGRAGMMGVSYPGWLASVALVEPHPALAAVSPQAPMTDVWLGDDFFHNGSFRQSYAYEFVKSMESSRAGIEVALDKPDAYDWYLSLPTLSKLTEMLGGKLPSWNSFVAHPNYDRFWKERAAQRYLKAAPVPTLVVGGWWDQEDLFGALATYQALEKHDKKGHVFLVQGPWNHGGWNGRGRQLGEIDFGSDTGKYFRAEIQAPWFAYYLKGKGALQQAEATIFQSGSNRWMTYTEYPPRRHIQRRNLYLQANGQLLFEKPKANGQTESFDSYVSDPANPVPYRPRPITQQSGWSSWLVQDQRFLSGRGDVLRWQTEPLMENVTITGDIIAHLFAATTGTDSDWVVKLIDVYPSDYPADPKMANYQLMVASEAFRGRFRTSFEKPAPIEPDRVKRYTIDLRGNDYVFRKGHRIMVQIQSSWFPLYDRNPQKFVPNIFLAKESDFQTATQRIYRSTQHPSHISISVAAR